MSKPVEIIGGFFAAAFIVIGLCTIITYSCLSSEIEALHYQYLNNNISKYDIYEIKHALSDNKITYSEYYFIIRDKTKTQKQLLIEQVSK